MTVYIVVEMDYDDIRSVTAFTDKEEAERMAEVYGTNTYTVEVDALAGFESRVYYRGWCYLNNSEHLYEPRFYTARFLPSDARAQKIAEGGYIKSVPRDGRTGPIEVIAPTREACERLLLEAVREVQCAT